MTTGKRPVHLGEVLEEELAERGMSQAEFARRVNYSPKHVNQIISGRAGISAEAALRFERVLGISAPFWLSLQANYKIEQARRRRNRRPPKPRKG